MFNVFKFTRYFEIIQKHDRSLPERILLVRVPDALQELDLVQSRLRVVTGRLDHFEGHKLLVLEVLTQPNCAEMAPTQLPDHVVAVVEQVSNFHWVISTFTIVTWSFLFIIVRTQDLFFFLFLILQGTQFRNKKRKVTNHAMFDKFRY